MSKELKNAISRNDVRKLQEIFCTTNVRLNNCHRYNPLIHACVKGSPVIAGALVKAGADVNVKVPTNYSILGALYGISDTLWNAIRYRGTVTPLILGVLDRNLELVQKLVQDCSADVNVTNEFGTAPLHCIASDAAEQRFPGGFNAWKKQEIAALLLKAGADANVQDKDGTTPLHSAATVRDLDYARRLLQHGASVDIVDNKGLTALHIAAHEADTQLLQLLLQQDVSQALVNQKTNDDATPLHVVITAKAYYSKNQAAHDRKKIPVVRLLIDNGADLTSQNHGLTPLHLAAEAGYLKIVKMLVEAGANIHAEAPFTCLTPLDMAKHGKKQDVVDYLVAKAAETGNYEGGRPKRDLPSVEQEEDNVSSQQTDTPVDPEETVEGAVGGIQQLDIKDDDSTDDE